MSDHRNTRIAVPLSPEAYDAISLVAKIGGVSRGRLLADTLEAIVPSYILIASAFRAAQAVEGEERAAMVEAIVKAEEALQRALEEQVGSLAPLRTRASERERGGAE
jgi:hypothetical protein